jgi:hydroxymethylbilane synthase
MEAEHFDGIVLAKAGIDRLGIAPPHVFEIPLQLCWPAAGQGAIGIECLSQRSDLIAQLAALDHADTSHCVQAERAFVRGLQGDCHSPIACLARMKNQMVVLNGHVVSPNGHERVEGVDQGPAEDAVMIGTRLAETLLQQGARKILDVPYDTVRSHLQF